MGERWNVPIAPLTVGGKTIPWVPKVRYLGVDILAAKSFSICLHGSKIKFFQSLNTILGRIGDMNAISLILSLTTTNCFPVLMYGLEACCLSKAQADSLQFAYNAVFCKVFKTFDKKVIVNCQYYTGILPSRFACDLGRLRFLSSICSSVDTPAGFLCKLEGWGECQQLQDTYGITLPIANPLLLKKKVWNVFANTLNQ